VFPASYINTEDEGNTFLRNVGNIYVKVKIKGKVHSRTGLEGPEGE